MLPLILAAINLPSHVGAPVPGEVTFALGVERTLPALDLRLPVARWARLDTKLEIHPQAPILGAEALLGAGGRRGPLQAHAFAGADLRPVFGRAVFSGLRLNLGVGLTGRWGDFVAVAEGGGALGLAFNPVDDDGIDPDAVDQQGGVFVLQRYQLGWDFFERVQLAGTVAIALPLNAVQIGQRDEALPTAEVRLGARVALRF